jgi:hypothetical protein
MAATTDDGDTLLLEAIMFLLWICGGRGNGAAWGYTIQILSQREQETG